MTTKHTEDQRDAAALLATVRHLLTGREIDLCEALLESDVDHDSSDEETYTGTGSYFESNHQRLEPLKIQFYAQITDWKNAGGMV